MALSSSTNAVSFSSARTMKTFSVAMSVHNPDRSPFAIERRDPAQAPSGFTEIVNDDFAFLHCERLLLGVQNRLRRTVKVESRSEHG
jgi:hypothetical protein